VRYDIHLHARVGEPRFSGTVRIQLHARKPLREVHLHAAGLDVRKARVGNDVVETQAFLDEERLLVKLGREAPPGDLVLTLDYEGEVSKGMSGLYLSKDGEQQVLATQCEETDARAVFPCMDEPEFKASLAWTVTTDPGSHVLTNAPLLQRAGDTWHFQPTPPISTYLAAVVIGPLASSPELKPARVPFRTWAYQGKEPMAAFANELATKLLPWFEDYFGQPYAYGKYDQVAVPSFSAGAMENAGLVTFRQALLLRDPKTTSFRAETQIARVVAHEMAHMWFGDLVTMAWWDDIWLNESFAEWVAHKCVSDVAPQYRVWGEQQAEKMAAMQSDALESTHPIYNAVERAEQATEMFDAITYYKGAATMRMLEAYLGHEPFRAGMRAYMREFREKNATGADLWRHLQAASGQPVARVMESWILQGGYPIVHATREGDDLVLRQERFLSSPVARGGKERWLVPVVVRHPGGETRALLDGETARVKLPRSVAWAYANADGVGFYRVDVDDASFDALVAHAKELRPSEQAALVDDQWALVKKGAASPARFLRLADVLLREASDDRVLAQVGARLGAIEDLLLDAGDAPALDAFRAWLRARVVPRLDATGAPGGDDVLAALRRAALLSMAASLGHEPAAIGTARDLQRREREDPASVDANLADPAVAIAAQFGDATLLDAYLAEYDRRRAASAPPAQVQRYLFGLAEFRDAALLRRVLDKATNGQMPLEASGPLLRLMLTRHHSCVETWAVVKERIAFVKERLGPQWTGFIIERAGNLPVEMRADVQRFFDAELKGLATQTAARALEALDQRAATEPRLRAELVQWFRRAA
jgi:puromycin-sensitive aminopeptidase